MTRELVRTTGAGARAVAPVALAVGAFGFTFGVLARDAGLGPAAAVVFSATTFAGSAQFAAASVLSAGGTLAAAIVAAILLNARYIPIGLSVAPALTGQVWKRGLRAQLVVDESWAIGHLGEDGSIRLASWAPGSCSGAPGSARRRLACSPVTCSEIRAGSGSTPPFRRSSWPYWRGRSRDAVASRQPSQGL